MGHAQNTLTIFKAENCLESVQKPVKFGIHKHHYLKDSI